MNTYSARRQASIEVLHAMRRTWLKQEPYEQGILRAVRAYALTIHVQACKERSPLVQWVQEDVVTPDPPGGRHCGVDWFCSMAQPYLPLEK